VRTLALEKNIKERGEEIQRKEQNRMERRKAEGKKKNAFVASDPKNRVLSAKSPR